MTPEDRKRAEERLRRDQSEKYRRAGDDQPFVVSWPTYDSDKDTGYADSSHEAA